MPRIDRLAKRMAPGLARIAPTRITRSIGLYLDVLQGRGAGTGWDMAGETRAVASTLSGIDAPVIFDGGANHGQWASALAAALDGVKPTFYLFEPQTACQESLERLPFRKSILKIALGDHEGEVTISAARAGMGAASIYERYDTYFDDMSTHQETIPVTMLDKVISEHAVPRVDLLKLDVEGAELAALHGARQSLEDGTIRNVAFEFGSANIYSRTFFRDFWTALTPLGYSFYRIAPGGRLIPIPTYTEELEHFRGVSNYVMTR